MNSTIKYRVSTRDGKHLCNVSFIMHFNTLRTGGLYGSVFIRLLSADKNLAGIKTKDEFVFEWEESANSSSARMDNMFISEHLRSRGLGTFIWYVLYENIPEYLRDNMFMQGMLPPQVPPEPRNSFLKKILCFDSDPRCKFLLKETGVVFFHGRLCSKKLHQFPKISVSIV